MKVVCVVGMPGSGKTTVAKVAESMNIFTITTGNIIREEIKRRGLEYTEANDRKMAAWFHQYGKERELIRRVVDKILDSGSPDPILIEGLRSPEQINELKKRLRGEELSILAVHCSPELRYKREKSRPRFVKDGYRFIKRRDRDELAKGLGNLIVMADYMIVNDKSFKSFKQTVKDKLIQVLNIKRKR